MIEFVMSSPEFPNDYDKLQAFLMIRQIEDDPETTSIQMTAFCANSNEPYQVGVELSDSTLIEKLSAFSLPTFLAIEVPWLACDPYSLDKSLGYIVHDLPGKIRLLLEVLQIIRRMPNPNQIDDRVRKLKTTYPRLMKANLDEIERTINYFRLSTSPVRMSDGDFRHVARWKKLLSELKINRETAHEWESSYIGEPDINKRVLPEEIRLNREYAKIASETLSPLLALALVKYDYRERYFDGPLFQDCIYRLFIAQLQTVKESRSCGQKKQTSVLVVGASPFFVQQILNTPLPDVCLTFVLDDVYEVTMLDAYVDRGLNKKDVYFVQTNAWIENDKSSYDYALIIGNPNNVSLERIYLLHLSEYNERDLRYMAIMHRASFENDKNSIFKHLSCDIIIENIAVLPQNLPDTSWVKRKVIVQGVITKRPMPPKNVDLVRFKGLWLHKDYLLTRHPYYLSENKELRASIPYESNVVSVAYDQLRDMDRTLLQLFNDSIAHGSSRRAPQLFMFSPELTIGLTYTIVGKDTDRPTAGVYCVFYAPKSAYKTKPDKATVGKQIKETKKYVKKRLNHGNLTPESVGVVDEHWLRNDYPASKLPGVPDKAMIDAVKELWIPELRNRDDGISFRAFAWFYRDLLKRELKEDEHKRLFTEIICTEIGDQNVRTDAETIKNVIALEQLPKLVFPILCKVVDAAVEEGYVRTNKLREPGNTENKELLEVRAALQKKHFQLSEMESIRCYAAEQIQAGQSEYIGVLIRLFTGLSTPITAELRWKDFGQCEMFGHWTLAIERKKERNGSTVNLNNLSQIRKIPLPDLLSEQLLTLRAASKPNPDEAIVRRTDGRELSSSELSGLKLPEKIQRCEIQLWEEGAWETVDIANYHGDFFRSNIDYWLMEACKFTYDEIQFYLGNERRSTLGRAYRDYLNDVTQFALYIKLQRLYTKEIQASPIGRSCYEGQLNVTIPAKPGWQTKCTLDLSLGQNALAELMIDSDMGASADWWEVTE